MIKRINPFNTGNPMTLRDAAVIATIAAFVVWILQFFANAQWEIIKADMGQWVFEAIKNYLVAWAGIFIAEAGLEEVVKRGQKPPTQ